MSRVKPSSESEHSRVVAGAYPVLTGLLLGVATLGLLACGGGGGGSTAATGSFGIPSRVALATLGFPSVGPNPGAVGIERAYPNLFFGDRPIYLTAVPDARQAPGAAGWIVVCEQDGLIHIFRNDDAVVGTSTLLDLSSSVGGPVSRATNEEGLLGFCIDPEFETNGRFYVHYSASGPRRSVIARYTATFPGDANDPPTATAGTQLVILEVAQPDWNHNAGMLDFGADGFLYISFGDGGGGGDTYQNGQDLSSLLGAMLRIDVRNATVQQPYVVPDNPFSTTPGAAPEIWAYGLRNPWRWSFDRNTGDLWLGDVGQGAREEIDVIVAGGNYGWNIYEGDAVFAGGQPAANFDAPVIAYPRTLGNTVVGGYMYRGQDVPTLAGVYLYADYGSGRIWGLVPDGAGGFASNTEIGNLSGICSFGEDENAELYACSIGGTIHRFTEPAGTPPPSFPGTLSETGIFTDVATLSPAAGFIEYEINAPFWSDDAYKRRWIGVPGSQTITFRASEPWTFPLGTVVVKHFELELTVGDPSSRRRLETRVLIRQTDGWGGYTYRWNDAQTEADLLPGSLIEVFTIQDVGGPRDQTWYYPDRVECHQCHTQAAGPILGPRTEQLNRDFGYPDLTDNQLRSWNHIGLFDVDIGAASSYGAYVEPPDPTADLADRARAYLATNCSQCHQPGGPAPGNLDFRYDTPAAAMGVVGVLPGQGLMGLPAPLLVDPGDHLNSIVWLRMQTLDLTLRMPRLGSRHVDQAGLDLIGAWIDSLGP